jgi:predicted nucleic-acid-binding Zn-ribbon protein
MSEEKKCLRCGGSNLEAGEFQSTGKIYSRPKNARLVTVLTTGVPVDTLICYDCGHVELVVDPKKAKSIARARAS